MKATSLDLQHLKLLKKGDVMYTKFKDKDITSMASYYKIKGLKTKRLICYNAKSKEIEEITKVIKE